MPPSSSELISAVGHPLRRRILHAYIDGSLECASTTEVARVLDRQVEQVAYHLKALAKSEILRPVRVGVGKAAPHARHGWSLDVEAVWLGLLLEVWAESDRAR
jgi:DNA-binding transcriptional ArsR family regulator